MTNRSNIRMLVASEFKSGVCGICGENATIKFRCVVSGLKTGDCCKCALLAADVFLFVAERSTGVRHPRASEAMTLPNT